MSAGDVGRFRYVGRGLEERRGDMKKKNSAVDYAMIAVGIFLTGFAIKNICDPISMITGGVSGVAIVVKKLWSVPLWLTNTALNTSLFAAELLFYGWRFIRRILFAMVMLSVSLYALSEASCLGNGLLLLALFGEIISGVGIGPVFLTNCITGGTGLLAALVQKRLKHYTLVQIVQALDGSIVAAGAFVFGIRSALYAPIAISCVAKATNGLIEGSKFSRQAYIISEHCREIIKAIMEQVERGVTDLEARGACSDQEKKTLLCAALKKKIVRLKETVAEFDSNAFVVVNDAREVFGEGFTEY